jgi:phosphonate transport system permease protein
MVGAGGIGVVINDSLNLFEWQRVSISLLTIFVLVILAEILVVSIRKRLI